MPSPLVPRQLWRSLRFASVLWTCCSLLSAAQGQSLGLPGMLPRGFGSQSGQFFVRVAPFSGERSPWVSVLGSDPNYIQLDAMLLPVSCDRIKQALWRELGNGSPWQSRIFVTLHPATTGDEPVRITSERFADGWQYQVDMPSLLQRRRYVRAVVEALLLEYANRTAAQHSAEIPYWLSVGLSQQLLEATNTEVSIIIPPPQVGLGGLRASALQVNAQINDPLQQAHQTLCAAPALTFQQLSWPTSEQLETDAARIYRSSAQLFVDDLLALPDGRRCLLQMLSELPTHYNWQLAFLRAFGRQFSRTLDVEKWWALQVVHFTGRELAQTWTPAESWRKLAEALDCKAEVRLRANALPKPTQVTLQTIIWEWNAAQQTQALESKLRELAALRLRLAPELVPLLDQYRVTLITYLRDRQQRGFLLGFGRKTAALKASQAAISQLDALDNRRAQLNPTVKSATTAMPPPALAARGVAASR